MNALESYEPDDIGDSDPADAVCALGFYGTIGRAAPNSASTFGCGTLIAPNMLLCARHSFPTVNGGWAAGYQSMTSGEEFSFIARFRRKPDGSIGSTAGGNSSYHLVNITGYLTPSPASDICIAYLAEAVDHIDPLPLSDSLASSDGITIAGWGVDGATLGAGSQPGDVRLIDVAAQSVVPASPFFGWPLSPFTANTYDSGGAVIKVIEDDWHLVGIITAFYGGVNVAHWEHNPSFQLPNFYTPSPDPDPPEEWTMPTNIVFPTFDGYIHSIGGVDVGDFSGATLTIAHAEAMGGYKAIGIFSFDTSVYTPTDIAMFLTQTANNTCTAIRVRRIRRLVTAAATFTTYDGSNTWTTPGGLDTTNDVFTDNEFTFDPADGANELEDSGLLAMHAAAKALGRDLQLHLQCTNTGGAFQTDFHSSRAVDPGVRPYLSVTTETPPTVTSRLQNITYNDATVQTTVAGDTITARGVCWSTSANPTTSDSKTTDGTGEGAIVSRMTPLNASTLYYARAYATNAGGTTYSTQMTFTTPSDHDARFGVRGAFEGPGTRQWSSPRK